jgi:hypothetical protein
MIPSSDITISLSLLQNQTFRVKQRRHFRVKPVSRVIRLSSRNYSSKYACDIYDNIQNEWGSFQKYLHKFQSYGLTLVPTEVTLYKWEVINNVVK